MRKIFLVVTIDTEEDQWGAAEGQVSVSNAFALPRLQSLFDDYGIVPTYLVNYPVAADAGASRILAHILDKGRCEIGTHLHPWNTPPVKEMMCNRNSMLGNLPYGLQLEKIAFATEFLERRFGVKPMSFRAGRWGLGQNTINALVSCGYEVDTSVTPFLSWETCEGPSFVSEPIEPYLMGVTDEASGQSGENAILEIPATIGYSRWPFTRMRSIERMLERLPVFLRAKGFTSQLNIVRKISMDPEAEKIGDMLLLSRIFIERGIKVLNMFFHSNSLVPGLTPFIRTEDELNGFYRRLATYFEAIRSLADIKPIGLSQMRQMICRFQHENGRAIGIL